MDRTPAPFEDYDREFDVVVYGATGFTGENCNRMRSGGWGILRRCHSIHYIFLNTGLNKLAAEHMCDYYLTSNGEFRAVKFALAGRCRRKLEDVLVRISRRLQKPLDMVPLLIADSTDPDSLSSMCERTRVVATTVGPYLTYGEPLVAACVNCKTHYCDITGELPFVAKIFRTYGQRAAERGLKIVHTCGWMSVATDLSCLLLENTSLLRARRPCEEVKSAVTKLHGGVSGGTLASLEHLLDDPSMYDRYYLCKHALRGNFNLPQKPPPPEKFAAYDKDFGYTGTYIGGSVDETVVRWTSALLGNKYGKNFTYSLVRAPAKAGRLSTFLTSLAIYMALYAFRFRIVRSVLYALRVLPRPGQGPSRDTLEHGYYEMRTVGRTPLKSPGSNSWKVLRTEVVLAGDSDPGYRGAAKMLCEAAVCMAEEMDGCTSLCGVLSPGAGIGEALGKRLRGRGVHIGVECMDELPEDSPST